MTAELSERARAILGVVRARGGEVSRSELASSLGIARATVTEGLAELESLNLILPSAPSASTGGRPAQTFHLNPNGAAIGIIDVGGSRTRVGIANLTGEILQDALLGELVSTGPEVILGWAVTTLTDMFATLTDQSTRRAIIIGLPGPVDFTSGRVVSPPIMSNWQGFDVRAYVAERLQGSIVIDNDVNLIALAEQRLEYPDSQVMLVIKLGTGIGGGLVINGTVLRGARGAAGDIGHIQSTRAHGGQCRCGHIGCVEAVAGGWALVQALQDRGIEVDNVSDVAHLVRDGDPTATSHVRAAAKVVGQATAQAVSLLNPDTVVIAGEMLAAGDTVLATIRESIYQYSLPLATHDLRLVPSALGPLVGLRGGTELGIDVLTGAVRIQQLESALPAMEEST